MAIAYTQSSTEKETEESMNISETAYITVTNRVKVTAAISLVRGILPGFDGVTTDEEQKKVLLILQKWEDELFAKIDTDEDD